MFRVTVQKAEGNSRICESYLINHRQALYDYGIKEVGSLNDNWFNSPDVFMINAYDNDGALIGGARIGTALKSDGTSQFVECIKRQNVPLPDFYKAYGNTRIGELSGFWVSKKYRGKGIAQVILKCIVAVLPKLDIEVALCLSSLNIFSNLKLFGFESDKSLGNMGEIDYPKAGIISVFAVLKDPGKLSKADRKIRREIIELREGSSSITLGSGDRKTRVELDLMC